MQDLAVTLVQPDLQWEDPEANRAAIAKLLAEAPSTDLHVLPETFTSGFTMEPARAAEAMDGPTVTWMQELAAARGGAIAGSLAVRSGDAFVNRLVFAHPDGSIDYYDKRHLFRMSAEHERYSRGHQRTVVNFRGWRILLQVCYDLRFPVFSRNRADYDLVLYVANWPSARRRAWRALLPARAIENMAYCIGVSRVGTDGNGVHYAGDSAAYSFLGESLADCGDEIATATLTCKGDALVRFREKFPAHLDADDFDLAL